MSTIYDPDEADQIVDPEQQRALEAEVQRHVRIFKTPPANFDATCASDRELVVHGLPPRPNPHTHPRLAAKWQRVAAHRLTFVRPEFEVRPSIRTRVDRALLLRRELLDVELTRYRDKSRSRLTLDLIDSVSKAYLLIPESSTNWSGAYVKRPAAEPLFSVTGEWTIPGVNPPASAWNGTGYNDGTYLCGVWVGIDGTQGTGDVMQAGTGSQCVVKGGKMVSTQFFAWVEWFTLPSITITTFPVQVGDLISCTVCAPLGPTHGTALFNNLTSGLTTNIGIDPPASTSLVGNVAEWIVEDPSTSANVPYPFPNYGSTHFTDCVAASKNIELDLGVAREIDLVDSANRVLSSASIENHRTLFCRYGSL